MLDGQVFFFARIGVGNWANMDAFVRPDFFFLTL